MNFDIVAEVAVDLSALEVVAEVEVGRDTVDTAVVAAVVHNHYHSLEANHHFSEDF